MSDNSKIEWTDATWNPVRVAQGSPIKAGVKQVKKLPFPIFLFGLTPTAELRFTAATRTCDFVF